jgi:predicted metalloprotease with PDZ domain
VNDPGRRVRSAEEMSRMAPFIDGGLAVDRTNWRNTVISYYSFGGAIALALDLTLRDRTDNRVSLDDFMRAMWRTYGKPGGAREGYVDRPERVDSDGELSAVLGRHKPGDRVPIKFVDRSGRAKTVAVRLAEDPHLEVVPAAAPTAGQRWFRDQWLGGFRIRN